MIKPLVIAGLALGLFFAGPATAALEIGKKAPDFTLKDLEGKSHHLADYLKAGKTVVLEWFNPECPFIKKHHATFKTMNETYAAAAESGVVWLAINSGAKGKQGAGLERNLKAHKEFGMSFPLLLDETGEVGKAYGAKTTPHMFVIAPDGNLIYQGAIDSDPSPDKLGETNYVASALAAAKAGEKPAQSETRPYGCSVKYSD